MKLGEMIEFLEKAKDMKVRLIAAPNKTDEYREWDMIFQHLKSIIERRLKKLN